MKDAKASTGRQQDEFHVMGRTPNPLHRRAQERLVVAHQLLGVLADVLLKALTKAPAGHEASDDHQENASAHVFRIQKDATPGHR
ncbi:hypothetical protein [Archangium lipolyticum]|uniref:hypothetical protein n=1 Tax=Archangium lipolyticum TaxID=2970465 RepID=UPI00214A4D0F|nr:hypothetical protein [Archangium lipolyticum]